MIFLLGLSVLFLISQQVYTCSVDPHEIKYFLYNKDNLGGLTPFSTSNFIPGQLVFVLLHGWTEDSSQIWISSAKNSILTKYPDSNVIVIDYGKYSKDPIYFFTWCSAPIVGKAIAEEFHRLSIQTDQVNVIGFSIGAQIAGAAAREVKKLSMAPFAAIICLDAAGVGYEDLKPVYEQYLHEHVKSGDASKVIGFYSSRNSFGFADHQYADINIFINDGSEQDCPPAILCPFEPLEMVKPCLFCAHIFARETFVKAIPMAPEYTARKCSDFDSYASCSGNTKFVLQVLTPANAENGLYFIKIDSSYNQVD